MASGYPGALDSLPNPGPTDALNTPGVEHDVQHANANDAIEAIEGELGTDPAGAYATVKARLEALSGRVFDVVAYGAAVNGSTNDTAAWQSAIDAAAAAGGGVVTSSKSGVSVISGALQDTSGANSQLVLPAVDYVDSEAVSITIRGTVQPPTVASVIGATPIPDGHLVLKSTLATGTGSVIGGVGPAGTFGGFTSLTVRLENLTVRTVANPTITGLNLSRVACVELDGVVVDTGSYDVEALTEPTTATSYGIRLPGNNNGACTRLGLVDVVGFYKGYQFAEHTNGGEVHAWGCKIAAEFGTSNHASVFTRFMAVHCQKVFTFTGAHAVDVWQLDIEHANSSQGWRQTTYDVDDASNLGKGFLRWHAVLAGTGDHNSFTVNGATGFTTSRVGAAIGGASSSALTVQDENANVSTAVTQIDFQGAGVTTTAGTGEVIVTIPGTSGTAPITVRDRLVAAAGNTILTLGATPVAGSPLVWVNNTIKWPGTDYTISGSVITFGSALSASDVVLSAYQTTASSPSAATLGGASVNIVDDFNRTNSTTSLGSTSVGSKTWVQQSGQWGIVGNQSYLAASGAAVRRAYVESLVADCTVSTKIYQQAGTSRYYGLFLRGDASGNGYLVQINADAATIDIQKSTGGSLSAIGTSAAYAAGAGDVISAVLSGSSITVKVNGVTYASATDSTYATATKHGLWCYETDRVRFDDFSIQP